ncbi:hydrogenase maturation nickel metallochaperone HypA [Shewanella saliphila]|uniref:Hydrogenase maturation factor HypA n=1 Tax=Shewanella saliphila TaxID=2282698 RepID=A0ABQ2Q708_9GAMM|nr:hydrogenase maturation nickel metallochaperone HypA [Shewanella saliphila]MCL1100908.1 hydrogenase maturation nickel metallochaperone HypA [Shewanella saliphila]GGP57804.1 putative hydrogenase nickel incorporation protein HypA [Shewanella saliphila]
MHEYSIVMSLMEQCESLALQHQAQGIEQVELKIGILSGVEPALLAQAFETFKLETICHNAKLVMNIQPLVLQCRDCDQQSQVDERTIICPICTSNNTLVIDGEDMMLMQLVLDT